MGNTRGIAGFAALALGIAGALIATTPAQAAVCVVSNDGNGTAVAGTLAYALDQNNLGNCDGVIQFSVNGTFPAIAEDLPDITEDLVLMGNGSAATTVQGLGDVLVITGATVAITGLTLAGASATSGIVATDATLTLDDVNADAFSDDGIRVTDSSFVADDVRASFNGDDGIDFTGSTASDALGLTEVVASFNSADGVHAAVTDSTADLDDVFAEQNTDNGVELELNGSVLDATEVVALTNTGPGFRVELNDAASGSVTGGRAAENELGYIFEALGASTLTVSGVHAFDNILAGLHARSVAASAIDVIDSEADHNHGDGFWLTGESGQLSLQNSRSHENGTDLPGSGVLVHAVQVPSGPSSVRIVESLIDLNTNATSGGGVHVVNLEGSALSISGTTIADNAAVLENGLEGLGGGIYVGIFDADATLDITDSFILGNSAAATGGGVYLDDVGGAAATGAVAITRTTIDGNTVTGEAGIGGGIMVADFSHRADGGPVVAIDSSTLSNNSAALGGGLVANRDDSDEVDGVITVVDSTVSGNVGAGAAIGGDGSVLRLLHSTVVGNDGIGVGVGDGVQLVLSHTILAGNADEDLVVDDGALLDATWNIVQVPDAGAIPLLTVAEKNRTGIDPELGPLAPNGGPTLTHLPLEGSPAINTGDPAFAGPPALDQRGDARIVAIVDIGAVEVALVLPATGSAAPVVLWASAALLLVLGLGLLALRRSASRR